MDEPTSVPAGPGNGRGKVLLGVLSLLALALGMAGYWYCFMLGVVSSDDARFNGHLVDIAPEVSGTLVKVAAEEGRFVKRGEPLFLLDSSVQRSSLAQAEGALATAEADVAVRQAKCDKALNGSRPGEVKAAEATVRRLEGEEANARSELARMERLAKSGAVSRRELDNARTDLTTTLESKVNASETLKLLREGSRVEDIAAAKADMAMARSQVAEARDAVARAKVELARCTVSAPFSGWVVRRWLEPGAMPIAGHAVVSLFDPATLRVDANIEERFLCDVAVGDLVDIAVDAYPDLRLQGRVEQILRATNSQFGLIPAEGVSGTFIKVVQRVPLRIALLGKPPEIPLGPGLSAEVRVHSRTAAR